MQNAECRMQNAFVVQDTNTEIGYFRASPESPSLSWIVWEMDGEIAPAPPPRSPPPATPQVDSPLARLHSMDRRIAARVGPLGAMPRTPAPRPQDLIEVEFGEGRLGLELDWPRIEQIVPGSLACRVRGRRCGRQLRPGMTLAMIAGADCTALTLEQAHAIMVAAGRPLTLCFSSVPENAPEPELEPERSVALALDAKFADAGEMSDCAASDSACEGETVDELPPWRRIAASWAQPPHPVSTAPVQVGTQYIFDSIAGRWRQSSVRVRLSTSPFRSGSMRTCFRMLVSEVRVDGRLLEWMPRVAKVYTLSLRQPPLLDPETHAQMLRTDVRVHERTRELATMYNSRQPPKKVAVLPATIVTIDSTNGTLTSESPAYHHHMYFVEPFLPGEYVKHTSNYGFVGFQVESETQIKARLTAAGDMSRTDEQEEEEEPTQPVATIAAATARQTPQCFSYFSWHASGGKELVSDIQGVQDIYTDPQIHSLVSNVEKKNAEIDSTGVDIDDGAGNLGHAGIVACLSTHLYSPQDYYLGLPPFFLSSVEVAAVQDKLARENGYDIGLSHRHTRMQALSQSEPEPDPQKGTGLTAAGALHVDSGDHAGWQGVSLDLNGIQKSTTDSGGTGGGNETDTPVIVDASMLPVSGSRPLDRTYSGAVCPRRAASLSALSARTLGVSLHQCSSAELLQHGEMHCCFGLHYCWPWWQSHRSNALDDDGGHSGDLLVLPHPLWHASMELASHTGDQQAGMDPSEWSTTAARFHLALAVGIARRIRQQYPLQLEQLKQQPEQQQQWEQTESAWIAAMASFATAAAAADCNIDDTKCDKAHMHQTDAVGTTLAEETGHMWKEFASDWLFVLRHWGTRAWAPPCRVHHDGGGCGADNGWLLQRAELLWKSVGSADRRNRNDGVRPSLTMIARAVDVIEGQGWASGPTSPIANSPIPPGKAASATDERTDCGLYRSGDDPSSGGLEDGSDHTASSGARLDVETLGRCGLALE